VHFEDSYILETDAISLLAPRSGKSDSVPPLVKDVVAGAQSHSGDGSTQEDSKVPGSYERLVLHGYPYLCFTPEAKPNVSDENPREPTAADRETELSRAVDRASQLLQGMASNQCLYYSTGWWTYSFCYNSQVTQFHALPPGTNGRVWPPQEDPTTPSYVLGKFEGPKSKEKKGKTTTSNGISTEVQTKAETNYLVQRLGGGTPCDLTGNERKIEVQFHCNPQLTDRIGWIKETATCAYMMIVYTPRLCNDVTFQPPKESRAHQITCREIVSEGEVAEWRMHREAELQIQQALDQTQSQQIVLGGVQVGAMKLVGREGKRLERGRIVLTQDEKAETVVMQKNGQISSLSKAQLKKLDLSEEDIESFQQELQKLAAGKDWKIERLDDVDGHIQLRGVVATDDEDGDEQNDAPKGKSDKDAAGDDDEAVGSQEEYADTP
jgi:hypothetical protein